MRLFRHEDVAILLVSELAACSGEAVSLTQVAKSHGVSGPYLKKIARLLRLAHLISGKEGLHGGYQLTKSPQELNLWHVLSAVSPIVIRSTSSSVICPLNKNCLPQTIRNKVNMALERSLASIKITDIVH